MDEYIERRALIRYAEKQKIIIKDGTSAAEAVRIQGNAFRRCVETCPTAEVVPKSEVERLRSENADLQDALNCQVETNAHLSGEYLALMKESESQKAEIERLTVNMNAYGLAAKRLAEEKNNIVESMDGIIVALQESVNIEDALGRECYENGDMEGYHIHQYAEDKFESLVIAISLLRAQYMKGETYGNKADTEI